MSGAGTAAKPSCEHDWEIVRALLSEDYRCIKCSCVEGFAYVVNDLLTRLATAERELKAAETHHDEHHAREGRWKPPCMLCESQPHDCSPCPCDHAPCVHDFNAKVRELSTKQEWIDTATRTMLAQSETIAKLECERKELTVSCDVFRRQRDEARGKLETAWQAGVAAERELTEARGKLAVAVESIERAIHACHQSMPMTAVTSLNKAIARILDGKSQ